jgi:hypothetical protein
MKIFSIHQQQIRLGDDLEILFFIDRLVNQDQQERKSDFSINIFLCTAIILSSFCFFYVLFAQEKHIHTHTHTYNGAVFCTISLSRSLLCACCISLFFFFFFFGCFFFLLFYVCLHCSMGWNDNMTTLEIACTSLLLF